VCASRSATTSNKIYTRSECRRAALRLKITRIADRNGDKRWPLYSVSVYMPFSRQADSEVQQEFDEEGKPVGRRKKLTSIGIDRTLAGAMLLAADLSVRDLNAACRRASEMLDYWLPFPDAPAFGHVVAELALWLLRFGWKRKMLKAEQEQVQKDAYKAFRSMPTVAYYEDPSVVAETSVEDADAIYAREHAARVASEYGL
jgi:hypothetical protein